MKVLFMVIAIFCFTGCKTEESKNLERAGAVQEMHDKVASVVSQLKADCDSNLYQIARQKADSILAKRKVKANR
jgi:hypothetical protein